MVSGEPLSKPVVLSNSHEILAFQDAVGRGASVDPASLADRPYLTLSLFWGDRLWEPFVRERRLDELRPEDANQAGRYYPAVDGEPAVVHLPFAVWRDRPKIANDEALAILARHGVPVEVDDSTSPWIWAAIAAGASLLAGAVVALRRRKREEGAVATPSSSESP